jgi:hypothetical protein
MLPRQAAVQRCKVPGTHLALRPHRRPKNSFLKSFAGRRLQLNPGGPLPHLMSNHPFGATEGFVFDEHHSHPLIEVSNATMIFLCRCRIYLCIVKELEQFAARAPLGEAREPLQPGTATKERHEAFLLWWVEGVRRDRCTQACHSKSQMASETLPSDIPRRQHW